MEKEIINELAEIKKLTLLGTKKVLTLSDLSLLSGISKSTLYKMVQKRMIPHYKNAKLLYFEKNEIESYLLQNRISTNDEIETQTANFLISGKK